MKQFRRLISCACALSLILSHGSFPAVYAEGEDPDFSDTSYWNNLCTQTQSLSDADVKNCQAYTKYMQEKNAELQSQIADIDSRREEISAKIADYDQEIQGYNAQIAGITGMIEDLSHQITAVEEQIADIQNKIDTNQAAIVKKQEEIDTLKDKVADRIAEQQKTMRLYPFLDILMGAASFDDFIRLANGINDIYAHDSHSLEELNDNVIELGEMKEQLLNDQQEIQTMEAELETGRQMLDSQQAALLSSRYELQILQQSYNDALASADSEKANAQNAIAANENAIGSIQESIGNRKDSDSGSGSSEDSGSGSAGSATPKPASTPSSGSSSGSSDAPETGNTSGNPYYGGWANCTWGTWQLVHDTLGISLPGWGMAGNWLNDAARSGYATGSTPKVYSIAVYSWHVAFVTAVNGDQVYIKEGNYLGHYYERWVPASGLPYTGQTCLGYIYL